MGDVCRARYMKARPSQTEIIKTDQAITIPIKQSCTRPITFHSVPPINPHQPPHPPPLSTHPRAITNPNSNPYLDLTSTSPQHHLPSPPNRYHSSEAPIRTRTSPVVHRSSAINSKHVSYGQASIVFMIMRRKKER